MSDTIHANNQKQPQFATQMYMRIAEIHDNIIVLKNGGLRAVISVASVNINLKSEDEQTALIMSYQGLLNSLEFPIEIVVKSRKLDISGYLDRLRETGKHHTNPLMRAQVVEYTEYIRRLVELTDIMEKQFYIVVPYDPIRAVGQTVFQKFWDYVHPADSASAFRQRKNEFTDIAKKLIERVDQVKIALENCNLACRQLETKELIEIFYNIYNPLSARNEKMPEPEKMDLMPGNMVLPQMS